MHLFIQLHLFVFIFINAKLIFMNISSIAGLTLFKRVEGVIEFSIYFSIFTYLFNKWFVGWIFWKAISYINHTMEIKLIDGRHSCYPFAYRLLNCILKIILILNVNFWKILYVIFVLKLFFNLFHQYVEHQFVRQI